MKKLIFYFFIIFISVFPASLIADSADVSSSGDKKNNYLVLKDLFKKDNYSKENIEKWFEENFSKVEEFRKNNLEKLRSSKDRVNEIRISEKDSSTATKILVFIHFLIVLISFFVFSHIFIFYPIILVIIYKILRYIWVLIRRSHSEE